MQDKREVKFTVETKEAGQRRKYGDSFYHYIVESKQSVYELKRYCTKLLKPAIPVKQWRDENNCADNHFRSYYTKLEVLQEVGFLEEGVNIVEYKVTSPSTH